MSSPDLESPLGLLIPWKIKARIANIFRIKAVEKCEKIISIPVNKQWFSIIRDLFYPCSLFPKLESCRTSQQYSWENLSCFILLWRIQYVMFYVVWIFYCDLKEKNYICFLEVKVKLDIYCTSLFCYRTYYYPQIFLIYVYFEFVYKTPVKLCDIVSC